MLGAVEGRGEVSPCRKFLLQPLQVVNARVDREPHGDTGDHRGPDVDGQIEPAHDPHHQADGQQVGNQRDQPDPQAAEGERHHRQDRPRRERERQPLIVEQALGEVGQQHVQSGRAGGGFSHRLGERLAGQPLGLFNQGHLFFRAFAFVRTEEDPHASRFGVVETAQKDRLDLVQPAGLRREIGNDQWDAGNEVEPVARRQHLGEGGVLVGAFGQLAEAGGEIADLGEKRVLQFVGGGEVDLPGTGTPQVRFDEVQRLQDGAALAEVVAEVGLDRETGAADRDEHRRHRQPPPQPPGGVTDKCGPPGQHAVHPLRAGDGGRVDPPATQQRQPGNQQAERREDQQCAPQHHDAKAGHGLNVAGELGTKPGRGGGAGPEDGGGQLLEGQAESLGGGASGSQFLEPHHDVHDRGDPHDGDQRGEHRADHAEAIAEGGEGAPGPDDGGPHNQHGNERPAEIAEQAEDHHQQQQRRPPAEPGSVFFDIPEHVVDLHGLAHDEGFELGRGGEFGGDLADLPDGFAPGDRAAAGGEQAEHHGGGLVVGAEADAAGQFADAAFERLQAGHAAERLGPAEERGHLLGFAGVDPGDAVVELFGELGDEGQAVVAEFVGIRQVELGVAVADEDEFVPPEELFAVEVVGEAGVGLGVERLDRLIEGEPLGWGERDQQRDSRKHERQDAVPDQPVDQTVQHGVGGGQGEGGEQVGTEAMAIGERTGPAVGSSAQTTESLGRGRGIVIGGTGLGWRVELAAVSGLSRGRWTGAAVVGAGGGLGREA